MTDDVLLIFLNSPVENSQLLSALGEQQTREINEKLQVATHLATKNLSCKKIVFYASENFRDITWDTHDYNTQEQTGIHLNERIRNAFNRYIIQNKENVNKVVFITADCPNLTQTVIEKAFESLNKNDVCIA